MGLFRLHNCCASSSWDYLKNRLSIPEYSGYHCRDNILQTKCKFLFFIYIDDNTQYLFLKMLFKKFET